MDSCQNNEDRLTELLRESLTGYEQLLSLNEEILDINIQAAPEAIESYRQRVKSLLVEIQKVDNRAARVVDELSAQPENPLHQQRQELLQRLEEQNRLISEKIRGMMSLISAEIGQLRGGMTAMSGYHGDCDQKGSVLKKSC
ncbi:hypothetical protein MJO47_15155 [Desulfuromonas sp. KJ2020]|uniref:hypothetical protein n=1 Tax=Desulfuromonas sp. KJ2020 TaxID=2919173 RepID=UPI0020A797AB|nr:hypothetical protein [Desulfuromonas sp. KJ2020]MCP3178443.1 hypothetical protein [Desulfuromonas sp. KJ2020]